MSGEPAAPVYHYDPNLGDPHATYTAVDFRHTHRHRPEVQARFVACVTGETLMRTLGGRKVVRWRAEPGTPCLILGYWSDGTVHLSWPGIRQHYRVDGRFPGWVVAEEADPAAVRDPHTLPANLPWRPRRPALAPRLLLALLVVGAIVGLVGVALAGGGHLGPF